jgi:hypothetical protein
MFNPTIDENVGMNESDERRAGWRVKVGAMPLIRLKTIEVSGSKLTAAAHLSRTLACSGTKWFV